MNILLLVAPAPPEGTTPFSTAEKRPPLGVASLIAVLRKAGHTVYFEDFYLHKVPLLYDARFLLEKRIDMVGMYSSSITWGEALKLLQRLHGYRERGIWKGLLSVGGPHTSFNAPNMPKWIDYIVIGEGEKTICDIAEGKVAPGIIRGTFVEDMDSLPLLPWEDIVPRPYDRTGWGMAFPVYTLNTSRGCPFNCTFCSVKGIWGKSYRCMSVERVMEELSVLRRYYGLQSAYFREDHFTLNRRRTLSFCEELLRRDMRISWACESRADSIDDEETLRLMARSGCKTVYIGVESGSPRMLRELRKGETVEQFERVFALCRKYGIRTYASMIYGVPGETEEDVRLTEAFLRRISPDFIGRNVFAGLPGSELYDKILELDLCAYEDKISGVRYLKGHNERARKYYGPMTRLLIPGTPCPAEPASPPPVSVITCVYNGEDTIARCIESIQQQTHKEHEHIIIDDGSSDTTSEIVRAYANKDSRIRLLRNETNRQRSYSRNRGLAEARYDLAAILDADDTAVPDRLECQADYLRRNERLLLCGGILEVLEKSYLLIPPFRESSIRATMLFQTPFLHSTVMFHCKEVLSLTGGYDEQIPDAQDYALWLRLAAHPTVHFQNIVKILGRYSSPPGKRERTWPKQEVTVRNEQRRFMQQRGITFTKNQEQIHIDTFIGKKVSDRNAVIAYCKELAWCKQTNPLYCSNKQEHTYALYELAVKSCKESAQNKHWFSSFMKHFYYLLQSEEPFTDFDSFLTKLDIPMSEKR